VRGELGSGNAAELTEIKARTVGRLLFFRNIGPERGGEARGQAREGSISDSAC